MLYNLILSPNQQEEERAPVALLQIESSPGDFFNINISYQYFQHQGGLGHIPKFNFKFLPVQPTSKIAHS